MEIWVTYRGVQAVELSHDDLAQLGDVLNIGEDVGTSERFVRCLAPRSGIEPVHDEVLERVWVCVFQGDAVLDALLPVLGEGGAKVR